MYIDLIISFHPSFCFLFFFARGCSRGSADRGHLAALGGQAYYYYKSYGSITYPPKEGV